DPSPKPAPAPPLTTMAVPAPSAIAVPPAAPRPPAKPKPAPAKRMPQAPSSKKQLSGDPYLNVVWKLIMARVKLPPDAVRDRLVGVVYFRFAVGQNGEIVALQITRSSGIPLLDMVAEEAIRRAAPFPPPPSDVFLGGDPGQSRWVNGGIPFG